MTDQTDPTQTAPAEPVRPSRLYMMSLTAAILLLSVMITILMVLVIIRDTDNDDSETSRLLTAAFADASQTQTALAITPTPAPPVSPGVFAFQAADSPNYDAAPSCNRQIVTGLILNSDGQPTDAFSVQVWGDYTSLSLAMTGPVAGQHSGHWSMPLGGMLNRRLWVQVTAGGRVFSAPVEIVFDRTDCAHNQAELTFQQVAPIE